jgi:hypothetical protein
VPEVPEALKRMSFKSHRPTDKTRQQAQSASGLGLPQDQIAALIGIAPDTLRKHYDLELGLGKAQASAAVAKTLFNKATVGQDTTAMIWWTKAQMRWSETMRQEVTGKRWRRDCDPYQQPRHRSCLTPQQLRAGPQG